MKKIFRLSWLFVFLMTAIGVSGNIPEKYHYTTVPGDPMNARIYTLDNGLKVYMTVNKEQPRIQTYIAVKVGGKNDPAETTGLAHYFEHLMFKGTTSFGTMNYKAERPLLDQIEQKFEVYRQTTDSLSRVKIYHVIDSLSYEASKYAIPNEYDKLMAAIGSNGSNAYTSYDVTCYMEDIPSNQIENWAKVQADRFKDCIIRGFHTELEAVYEEKNMSLTQDDSKMLDNILAALFPHHPYGTQTILGTQDDLKNPSITNIKNYFKVWYVPNNMAVCLSGDFDPDEMIAIIDKYFGGMKPNPDLPVLKFPEEQEITQPVVRDVYGLDAENVALAWRFPGAATKDVDILQLLSRILYNGKAGLIDLNLVQQQKVLGAYAYPIPLADYSVFLMMGIPKQGQSMEEVKDLLLKEVKNLREGNFDEGILQASINNFKLEQLQKLESNESRASMFVDSYINGIDWADEVTLIDRMEKLTKQDIMDFADRYLKDTNLAIVYKHQGKDPNEKKMTKPQITPIVMNRDTASLFLKEVQNSVVKPIDPVFLDFSKDLSQLKAKSDIPVLYKQNTSNDLFQLVYLFDMGKNNDKALGLAAEYLNYLGTGERSAEDIQREFYRLACSFQVISQDERTYVVLSGLGENMPAAMAVFEHLMADAKVDTAVYKNMVADELKARQDRKLSQEENFSRLRSYITYGPESPATNILSEAELVSMDPQKLVDRIKELNGYRHRILYYGPMSEKDLLAVIEKEHRVPAVCKPVPEAKDFVMQPTLQTKVYIAPYDAKQIYMSQLSNRGEKYDPSVEPARELFNEYFGGGMNSIVFQELRESRGLAYSAGGGMKSPVYLKDPYTFTTFIATQNDKMIDAISNFNRITEEIPQSEAAFQLAKDAMLARLRTERITKMDVIWAYVSALYLGQKVDGRIKVYNDIQKMTLQDVLDFHRKWVKGRSYSYGILGNSKDLDLEALKKIGPVIELTPEQIFGY